MIEQIQGFNNNRILMLIKESIHACSLDLKGAVVLTEAATGAYVVTPIIAALAGAEQVFAITKSSRYGSFEKAVNYTMQIAEYAKVSNKINIQKYKKRKIIEQADIITNSGFIRPIDTKMVSWMKPTAVIPLMYEVWEFREKDIDINACNERKIPVAGTNERHPAVNLFSFLGAMVIKLLVEAEISINNSRILLLCDNDFMPYIVYSLESKGAMVITKRNWSQKDIIDPMDAIIIALKPKDGFVLNNKCLRDIVYKNPGVLIFQFWGDVNRKLLLELGATVFPLKPAKKGHMGILPSAIGPQPIIQLQCGGLKVGELLWKSIKSGLTLEKSYKYLEKTGYGKRLTHNSNMTRIY